MLFPFTALDALNRDYPETWNEVDQLIHQRVRLWQSTCLLPSYYWRTIFTKQAKIDEDVPEIIWTLETLRLTAIGTWRYGKNIYRFHPWLEQELIASDLDCPLPFDHFIHLPEYCIFIETSYLLWHGEPVRGFWVYTDIEFETQQPILRFIIELEEGSSIAEMEVGDWNLRDGIERVFHGNDHSPKQVEEICNALRPLISLLLYVCCDGRNDVICTEPLDHETDNAAVPYLRRIGEDAGARLQRGRDYQRRGDPIPYQMLENESGSWRGQWLAVGKQKHFVCYWEPFVR